MDEIFANIDDVGKALDRAKVLDPADAAKAKAIVDSCINELKAVSSALGQVSEDTAGLFQDSAASPN